MAEADEFDTDLEQEVTGDTFEESGEEGAAQAAPKKSGGGFMFKAVVLVLALGGGVFFLARAGLLPISIPGLTPAKVQQAQNPVAVPPSPDKMAEVPMPTPAPAPVVATSAQELPPAIGEVPAATPIVPPVQPTTDPFATDIPAQNSAAAETQAATTADPFAAEPMPSTASASDSDFAAPAPEKNNVHVMEAEITPVAPEDVKAPEMMTGMDIKSAPVAPVQSAALPAAGQEEMTALQDRMSALEKKLGEMEAQLATKDDISAVMASVETLKKGIESSPRVEKEVESKPASSEPTAKTTPAKKAAKKTAVPVKEKTEAGAQWILRSAKPGTAWVSEKGSSEMKTVMVGDSLSGIGKVTAVFKDSTGRWVVKGTQGFVNQ